MGTWTFSCKNNFSFRLSKIITKSSIWQRLQTCSRLRRRNDMHATSLTSILENKNIYEWHNSTYNKHHTSRYKPILTSQLKCVSTFQRRTKLILKNNKRTNQKIWKSISRVLSGSMHTYQHHARRMIIYELFIFQLSFNVVDKFRLSILYVW